MENLEVIDELIKRINSIECIDEKIDFINHVKESVHNVSPFKNEPVDCVLWKKQSEVGANDYNPNSVAPPEMELLYTSILQDGYTQPIVAWKNDSNYEIVDGFHRHRVGKEYEDINERIISYLPITIIKEDRKGRSDRMASTIRHNRARGKHSVHHMSDIVVELKKRNWSNSKISKNLGMDEDEVLRLTQISGLEEMFSDTDFSLAWEVESYDDDENLYLE